MKSLLPYIEPLGLAWIGMTVMLGVFLWRRRWRPAALAGLVWLAFTLVTCTPVPSVLLAGLEKPWAGADLKALPAADAVLSLGGAGEPSENELVGFHFTRGTDRLMTAVDLVRREKAPVLVVGGGGYGVKNGAASEADAAKAWIDSWQVLPQPVVSLGLCSDTHDEAVKTAKLAAERGWKRIILVTSASHMKRAEATFRKAGIEAACAPCNFLSSVFHVPKLTWFHAPRAAGPEIFRTWLHEVIGWRVYRWRGWV